MENYILIYHFNDEKDNAFFKNELKKKFPKHKVDNTQELEYFAFPARHQPAVVDEITTIAHRMGISTKDYIALYYTRPNNSDDINREMLLGSDSLIETALQKISSERHRDNLIALIDYDFLDDRNN